MKKSLRTSYWFIASIFKRYAAIIISSLILGILFAFNANKIANLIPKSQTLYIGRAGSYDLSKLPIDIQQKISSGLTKIDETGKPVPDIALSWNIQESGRVYQFNLDPQRTWQDGKPVTSEDVEIGLQDVITEKPDEHTIIFRLKDPFSPFPVTVSQPLFRKVNYNQYWVFNRTKIIGTNKYSIVNIKTNSGIITELTLKSKEETRIYRFYPTEEDAITAYMLGHVDSIEQLSSPKKIEGWKNTSISKLEHTDRYLAIFFNTKDPNLSNKSVRQALSYALPKNNYIRRTLSPINLKSWAYNPQVKPYQFDVTQAKDLIAKAGGNTDNINITLSTTLAFSSEAEGIAKAWQELGIHVEVKIVSFPDTNNYQAMLIGQYIPKDPDQYSYWHSTQGTNFTGYNNPRIDKLLEDGRKTVDEDERTLIYQDFQRFLIEDSPAIFLHYLDSYTITRK